MKKIAFVAHEFGLFKGHGGVASYLSSIIEYLLNNHPDISVYVLAYVRDKTSPLLAHKNMHFIKIRCIEDVEHHLSSIKPDWVEVMDYLGLCVDCLVKKRLGIAFKDTVFALMHHTASRESAEWNNQMPLKFQPAEVRENFMRENTQMMLADIQMAPANFMARYVKQNYGITEQIHVFPHYMACNPKSKEQNIAHVSESTDLSAYKDSYNVFFISRIEGRKNQSYLVREFIRFVEETGANARLFLAGNSNHHELFGEDNRLLLYKEIPENFQDKIVIFDFLNRDQQRILSAIGDVCVLPSYFENFPIAMAERLAEGVPLIATRNSGCAEYIQPEWTFDPFQPGALCNKLKLFHKTSQRQREEIYKAQLCNYLRSTDPKQTIDIRIKLFEKYKSDKSKISGWEIVSSKKWDDPSVTFNSGIKNFVLFTNEYNDEAALKFIEKFEFTKNLLNKLIVLNNEYEYLNDLQDCVNRGLPLLFPQVDTSKFNQSLPIYKNLLNYALEMQEHLVVLKVPDINTQLDRKITDHVFLSSQKINLMDKYNYEHK